MSEEVRERYAVEVAGLADLHGPERKVVFHGVNKSGSLTTTNVLFEAYFEARRGTQFFSTYRAIPKEPVLLRRLIDRSTGHAFFGGHYLYGTYQALPGEVLLTTQLRNPLPRARSVYHWLVGQGKVDRSFLDWLPGPPKFHSQVRQFADVWDTAAVERVKGMTGDDLLEAAIGRLEKDLAWIGIAEYMEETALTFAALCGLPSVAAWSKDDRNVGRPPVDTWTAEEIAAVREVYAYDFELYEWGLARFRRQLAGLTFGPDLDRYRADCLDQYKDRLRPDGSPVTSADVAGLTARGSAPT